MSKSCLNTPIAQHIWETKYCLVVDGVAQERSIEDTWRRVANTLASVEERDAGTWEERFYRILEDFRFLPGGRILAGAGSGRRVTLLNCFVMGVIDDRMESIFDRLKEGALTMQAGGGTGYDFSNLRPRNSIAHASGRIASGPVSFMRIWDAMCATVMSTGARRGAMIASLRCDHPDIEDFVDAKRTPGELQHFNLSVQVTDALMKAVACRIIRQVPARTLRERLCVPLTIPPSPVCCLLTASTRQPPSEKHYKRGDCRATFKSPHKVVSADLRGEIS